MSIGNNIADNPILKVDLHVHTSERSACAVVCAEEQICAAIAVGLDAIFITDHHHFVPLEELERLNGKFAPFRIFGGIEVTCQEEEDFIILGMREARLETPGIPYAQLHALVRKGGGFIALAHPFRRRTEVHADLERFPPDAIEVHSPNTPPAEEAHIREMAALNGIPVLSNSDAHSTHRLGEYYNILHSPVHVEVELIEEVRLGRFTCKRPVGATRHDKT